MEHDDILHICAKRQVSSTLFDLIVNKLSSKSKAELMQAQDNDGNLPLHLAARTSNKEELHIGKRLIKEMSQMKYLGDSSSSTENGLTNTPLLQY